MNIGIAKFILRYSFRSFSRHRLRSFLMLFTVAFSVGISTVAARYADSVLGLWKRGVVNTGTGYAQFHHEGYWEKQEGMDPALTLKERSTLEGALHNDRRVEAQVRRFRFEGLIATDEHSSFFSGIAVEPAEENLVSPDLFFPGYDTGRFLDVDDRYSGVVGVGLAKILKLKIGDEATLIARTGNGSVNAVDIRVDGLIDIPIPGLSKRAVYLHLAHAQKLMRLPGSYSELAVRLKPGTDEKAWVEEVSHWAERDGAQVRGWWDIAPLIKKIEIIWESVAGLLCTLLMLSASLTIMNMIFIAVNERTSEIGTLMALGAKAKNVRLMFASEGAVIGLVGGALGCLCGNMIVWGMGYKGILFQSPFDNGILRIFPSVDLIWVVGSLVVATVSCAICAIPASYRASRLDPVVAIRRQ